MSEPDAVKLSRIALSKQPGLFAAKKQIAHGA